MLPHCISTESDISYNHINKRLGAETNLTLT